MTLPDMWKPEMQRWMVWLMSGRSCGWWRYCMEKSRTCAHTAIHQSCIMTEAHAEKNYFKSFPCLWGKHKDSFYFMSLKVQCMHVHLLYSGMCVRVYVWLIQWFPIAVCRWSDGPWLYLALCTQSGHVSFGRLVAMLYRLVSLVAE